MRGAPITENRGFTLVELLVVIGIFGVIMGAVYSIYLTHLRNAYSQEELIDVQQNLRTAMDFITRDLRMAGVLVPRGDINPLGDKKRVFTNQSTAVWINTASATGQFARINKDKETAAFSNYSTTVDSPEAIDGFIGTGTRYVRIIRPNNWSYPMTAMGPYLEIESTTRDQGSIVMKPNGGGTFSPGIPIKRGDVIAAVGSPPPPQTIPPTDYDSVVYALGPCASPSPVKCLTRTVNGSGTPEIIAGNIESIRFGYLHDDNSEDNNPDDRSVKTIRSVRVTINGKTSSTVALSNGPKTRQITSVIKLRNKP